MALRRLQGDTGLQGDVVACREAKVTEYKALINLVREALIKKLFPNDRHPYIHIAGLFPTEVVIEHKNKYQRYPYQVDENNRVTFGEPQNVLVSYIPAGVTHVLECKAPEPSTEHGHGDGISEATLLESLDGNKGLKWRVCVVKAGLSGNSKLYPSNVLREAAPLFNGCRVLNKADDVHLQGKGKSFENLIGKLSNASFVKASGTTPAHIAADLHLLESANVHEKMLEAYNKDMSDLFGFSIDAYALTKPKKHQGRPIREAVKFTKVTSLDLIIEPGAGGSVINLLEAQEDTSMSLLQRMLEALEKAPELLDGVDQTNEDEVLAAYDKLREAQTETGQAEPEEGADDGTTEAITAEQLKEALGTERARNTALTLLRESKLPAKAQEQLQKRFDGADTLTVETVRESISEMKELFATDTESGKVAMGIDYGAHYRNVDDGQQLFEALLDKDNKDVTSLKECYQLVTGDKQVTGLTQHCSRTRMVEALNSSSLPEVINNIMHKQMLKLYAKSDKYDRWRKIVKIRSLNDFKEHRIVTMGGFGDLSKIAEDGLYPELSKPSDSKVTWALEKRGGTIIVTLEMIANDDVDVFMDLPNQANRSVKRTRSKFFWNQLLANPNFADSKALFHADRSNLFTTPLNEENYYASYLAMVNQKERDTNEIMEYEPKYLAVGQSNYKTAWELFKRDTNLDKTFVQDQDIEIIPVPGWTDPNDWMLLADPEELPVVQAGFWNGNQDADLFVQDAPSIGQVFSQDRTTLKVRDIYASTNVDFRGATLNKVV